MRASIVAVLVVLLPVTSIQMRAQSAGGSADDMLTINGAKNPELIPQWSVWAAGFRYMAKDDIQKLPTVVLQAVTPEQKIALMKEANAAKAFDHECNMRALQFGKALIAEKPDTGLELANAKIIEATMSCRRHTLDVRDKLLLELGPSGAAALSGWVESLKAGFTTTVKKSQLKAYLLPE